MDLLQRHPPETNGILMMNKTRSWFGLLALSLGVACADVGAARAAIVIETLENSVSGSAVVQISGAIERGDAQRLQAHLASVGKGRQITVQLDSTGGSIDEALRIGRHFHANRIRTEVVGKGRACLSACALTFLAGRDASGAPWRLKGAEAEIGFHAFKRLMPDKEFTVADMQEAVATTQHALLAIADYLTAIGADIEFMSMMLEKPNSEMNYLGNDKALTLGVHVLQQRTGQLVRAHPAAPRS
jgi:hypothetical protein